MFDKDKKGEQMMRAYNDKLSEKVNAQLSRRERKVRHQKRFIVFSGVLILSIMILLGTSIHAFAGSKHEPQPVYKYYTSVRVEKGDTLWSVADKYMDASQTDKASYIREISELNHLSDDEIRAGEYLVVAYYSTEKK
jgi:cell division protein YceG involved in septum cleavage